MRAHLALVLTLSAVCVAACAPATATLAPEGSWAPSPGPGQSDTPGTTGTPPTRLVLWITPNFSTTAGTEAGDLLAARLDEFARANPSLTIEVRVKEDSGPGGLFESLAAASQAAPGSLPDLASMGAADLRDAALKGLIVSLGGMIDAPSLPDWYPFAVDAAQVDDTPIGLPFAADAEAFAYRSDSYPRPPATWTDLLDGPTPVLFPAGDQSAAFTLAQYLSLGGRLLDENGRPVLDAEILRQVLEFYDSARRSGVLPLSARTYADADATWAALRDGRAQAATASFRTFLAEYDPASDSLQPLPTHDGTGTCTADVWSWALVTRDPSRQELALRLLAWLTEPAFLGEWTHALGLLPTSTAALTLWPESPLTATANRLVTVARPRPTTEVLATFGPALHAAVEAVLAGDTSPDAAAQAAALMLLTP